MVIVPAFWLTPARISRRIGAGHCPVRFRQPCWVSMVGRERAWANIKHTMHGSSSPSNNDRQLVKNWYDDEDLVREPETVNNQTQHFPHWYVVESADEEKSLHEMSPFGISKAIKCQIGTVKQLSGCNVAIFFWRCRVMLSISQLLNSVIWPVVLSRQLHIAL